MIPNNRILISRLGGIGDCLIVTPLIRYLHNQGNEIYMLTSEQGGEIYKNNPYIKHIKIHERNSIPNNALKDYFESFRQAWECDEHISLSESIEVNLALYPSSPRYKYTKPEKMVICNKNYYEETFRFAEKQLAGTSTMAQVSQEMVQDSFKWLPEIYFTDEEEKSFKKGISGLNGKFIILWGLSGSARCKTYPYNIEVFEELFKKYSDVIIITVGDELCKILEKPFERYTRIIRKSGLWSIRESILACKYVNLVVSPDTGLLHGSGCFDTPKIGLLTHSTIENITKHFTNDYSISCDYDMITCAPCFQLHYLSKISCNLDIDGYMPYCMKYGVVPEKIIKQIEKMRNDNLDARGN